MLSPGPKFPVLLYRWVKRVHCTYGSTAGYWIYVSVRRNWSAGIVKARGADPAVVTVAKPYPHPV
jgi:hypothetical protein